MTDPNNPVAVAGAFIGAIASGEHVVIWDLLSDEGRTTALSVAFTNGLDRVVGGRIADGLADPVELDEFLRQLVGGLRRDLRSVDLDELETAAEAEGIVDHDGPTMMSVQLYSPSLLPTPTGWPSGRVILSQVVAGAWRVDRLEPVIAGP